MSLVSAFDISLSFPENRIFDKVGFQIENGDRIGLVGPNGAGKTCLLRLLKGDMTPDSGEIRRAKGTRISYLPQDIEEVYSGPLLKTILDSIPGRESLKNELSRVESALATAVEKQEQTRLAKILADIIEKIHLLDQEFPRHDAEKILEGLGFSDSDFENPVSTLSGGWKMRAALAGHLYRSPELLLLDEPTNHLDIPSIRWLEQFLQGFPGAIVVVSHDRDFLNRQARKIMSVDQEKVRSYSGNYDFYLRAREEEIKHIETEIRSQEQKIKEAQKFIDRFRAKASKARQAQSKIKLIKKMEIVERVQHRKSIRFSFPPVARSGREVIDIQGLSKGFGDKTLYEGMDLNVLRGERIAIIGPNGCGKTTLLKMIAGELSPDRGEVVLGHGVEMAYFAQHHSEMLNPQKTVIEEVYKAVPDQSVGFVRGVCGAFLFSGSDVDKKVGVLSGGEKARVVLAKLLVKPGNLMVMDEPTNHLDILSSEALIEALEQYTGTLLYVSHNQSFINRLATQIWDIVDREIVPYPGNLDEYYDHLERTKQEREDNQRSSGNSEGDGEGAPRNKCNRKTQKRERADQRRILRETIKPFLTELGKVEAEIELLELRQKELEKTLADPEFFKDEKRSVPLLKEYQDVKARMDALLVRWEQVHEKLESVKTRLNAV
ncbi:MAG: ABC-F family ATP-binding cassette domain-containing protein [Thermodesulfobacteriota bacterium]|nr:ABC-F family ATP-binding cassette domain-containing protein [Thermodesulfobacteriota bacterium]